MKIRYVGPHRPGVDVDVATAGSVPVEGDTVLGFVPYGEDVELPDDVAEGLLEQGEDHWKPAKGSSKKKEG